MYTLTKGNNINNNKAICKIDDEKNFAHFRRGSGRVHFKKKKKKKLLEKYQVDSPDLNNFKILVVKSVQVF